MNYLLLLYRFGKISINTSGPEALGWAGVQEMYLSIGCLLKMVIDSSMFSIIQTYLFCISKSIHSIFTQNSDVMLFLIIYNYDPVFINFCAFFSLLDSFILWFRLSFKNTHWFEWMSCQVNPFKISNCQTRSSQSDLQR